MRRARAAGPWLLAAVTIGAGLACRGSTEAPETGALLLRVNLATAAGTPDELRVWVYDDTGALWSDTRFPAEGALVPQSASFLGTILIQPGTTVGDVRLDLRGRQGGATVDEAVLIVEPAARAAGVFDLTLSTALPSDSDGDGVPDPIDDCPNVPDSKQTGCATDGGARDAGERDGGTAGGGAGRSGTGGHAGSGGASGLAGHGGGSGGGSGGSGSGGGSGGGGSGGGGSGGTSGHVGTGGNGGTGGSAGTGGGGGAVVPTVLPLGAACAAASQCGSGFCKDGACCDTACTDACNSCSTGTCTPITSGVDAPECPAPLSCNKKSKCVSS